MTCTTAAKSFKCFAGGVSVLVLVPVPSVAATVNWLLPDWVLLTSGRLTSKVAATVDWLLPDWLLFTSVRVTSKHSYGEMCVFLVLKGVIRKPWIWTEILESIRDYMRAVPWFCAVPYCCLHLLGQSWRSNSWFALCLDMLQQRHYRFIAITSFSPNTASVKYERFEYINNCL